ncbi:hypothetical protein [Lelliottia wanjuensis]|uniref:hypothetical protein n=1 Tax=Lelliottia wanjuensis TaxID=3050585 RepID=UPI00249D8D84|nr:hypothetical protein [Lelliottia sp. V89_13]MDK9548011.1 hypothetical protein [Lelliottia sp. V89_5]
MSVCPSAWLRVYAPDWQLMKEEVVALDKTALIQTLVLLEEQIAAEVASKDVVD